MDTTLLKEWFERKTCESCAFLSNNVVCFILGWSYTEDIERSKVANFYFVHHLADVNKADSRDFGIELKYGSYRRLGQNNDIDEIIMISLQGKIIRDSHNGGGSEKSLSRDDIATACAIRYIGNHFYVAGGIRSVLRRDGPNMWTNLTKAIQSKPGPDSPRGRGFDAIDGFSEDDIYAVGGKGDAWHYDGQRWSQIDLPTNVYLESVCCASDGQVYIGGSGHLILRGRNDYWQIVQKKDINSTFMQLVDYQGKVLGVDEWGSCIYQIDNDEVSVLDTGHYVLPSTSCVCLAVGHGMLLTAGRESANLFDGKRWRSLFEPKPNELDDIQLAETLLRQTTDAINKLSDGLR